MFPGNNRFNANAALPGEAALRAAVEDIQSKCKDELGEEMIGVFDLLEGNPLTAVKYNACGEEMRRVYVMKWKDEVSGRGVGTVPQGLFQASYPFHRGRLKSHSRLQAMAVRPNDLTLYEPIPVWSASCRLRAWLQAMQGMSGASAPMIAVVQRPKGCLYALGHKDISKVCLRENCKDQVVSIVARLDRDQAYIGWFVRRRLALGQKVPWGL